MLASALDRADQVIKEGREKVTELRSEGAALAELEQHLRKAVDAMHIGDNCNVTVAVHGAPRMLQSAAQDELYWIGREALTNAVLHAGATEIRIEITYQADQISLRCTDNGRGIDGSLLDSDRKEGHWGLIGMRERARALNCRLEIESQPGAGTSIAVAVPARKAYASPAPAGFKRTLFALWPGKREIDPLKP
jgi:signal transduction histidine kinase